MGLSIPDPLAALDEARGIFDRSQDLTLAIEEEFQIVDPETHNLVNRFAELKARTDAVPLGERPDGFQQPVRDQRHGPQPRGPADRAGHAQEKEVRPPRSLHASDIGRSLPRL